MALKQNLALNLFNNNFISSHLNVNDFFFTQLSCTSKCGSATVNKLITNTKTLFFFFGRGVGGWAWSTDLLRGWWLYSLLRHPGRFEWDRRPPSATQICVHTPPESVLPEKCPETNNTIIVSYTYRVIFSQMKKNCWLKYKIIYKSDFKIFPSENLMITEAKFLIILNILDRFWKTVRDKRPQKINIKFIIISSSIWKVIIYISTATPFIIEVITDSMTCTDLGGGVKKWHKIGLGPHPHHPTNQNISLILPNSSMNDECQTRAYDGVLAAIKEDAGGDVFGGVFRTRLPVGVHQL